MSTRIVLDTSAVRKHLHQDADRLDLVVLEHAVRDRTAVVSLPDTASAELLRDLLDGSIDWTIWPRVAELNQLLDRDMPILPGGRELADMAGLFKVPDLSEIDSRIYYRESWLLVAHARSRADLERGREYEDLRGRHRVRADEAHINRVFEQEGVSWKAFIDEMRNIDGLQDQNRREIASIVDEGMKPQPGEAADLAEKLEAQRKMLAHYIFESLKSRTPYNPESNRNKGDIIDLGMLMTLAIPNTVICTADTRSLINRLQAAGSSHGRRVVTPAELNQHLANGTLSSLLAP